MLVTCQGHLPSEKSVEVACQFQKHLCIFFIIVSGRIWGSCSTSERILIFENILPYGITQVAGLTNAATGSRSVCVCSAGSGPWLAPRARALLTSCSDDSPWRIWSFQSAGLQPFLWCAVPLRNPQVGPSAQSLASSQRIFLAPHLDRSHLSGSLKKEKKKNMGPQVRFGPGRAPGLCVLDCPGLGLPFNFHGENKEKNWTPGNCLRSQRLERWVLCAAGSSVSNLRISIKWQGRTPLWEKKVNTSQALPQPPPPSSAQKNIHK